jgi:hypothetical protein
MSDNTPGSSHQPAPERKAASDFGDSSTNVNDSGFHDSTFLRQPLLFKGSGLNRRGVRPAAFE